MSPTSSATWLKPTTRGFLDSTIIRSLCWSNDQVGRRRDSRNPCRVSDRAGGRFPQVPLPAQWAMKDASSTISQPMSGVDTDGARVLSAEEKMKARKSKAGARARFDVTALRNLAGGKVVERGEDYHADGQVEILSLEPERVLAQVTGSDDYRTVLAGRGKKIGGECSCPAFTDRGFCKHMVATALAANQALDFAAAGNGAAVDGAGPLGPIRAHLKTRGVDALADIILNLPDPAPTPFPHPDPRRTTPPAH